MLISLDLLSCTGLATHEAHFTILREDVSPKKKPRNPSLAEQVAAATEAAAAADKGAQLLRKPHYKPLQFLHIFILREYLEIEFGALRDQLPFDFNLERILDDFVFMVFRAAVSQFVSSRNGWCSVSS